MIFERLEKPQGCRPGIVVGRLTGLTTSTDSYVLDVFQILSTVVVVCF